MIRRIIRSFVANNNFEKGQYIPRTEPKPLKVKETYAELGQEMKNLFGQDYKTPYEKYDVHLPRTSSPDGPMPMYDRIHQKSNYKKAKRLAGFLFAIAMFYTFREIYYSRMHKQDSEDYIKMYLEAFELKKNAVEIVEKKYEERRKIVEQMREEAKSKIK